MANVTTAIPTELLKDARSFAFELPSQFLSESRTDFASPIDPSAEEAIARLHGALQNVGYVAYAIFLAHARAVADNEISRPLVIMANTSTLCAPVELSEAPKKHSEIQEPLTFKWTRSRYRIRKAAQRSLEFRDGDN